MEFIKRSRMPTSAEALFCWHERPDAFLELTPPGDPVRLVERTGPITEIGSRVVLEIGLRPFAIRWVAEHTACEPGRMFRDVQVKGPFARWEHTHLMEPEGPESSWLEDRVVYELPLGRIGRLVAGRLVRRKLERMFDYRHGVTRTAFEESSPARS